MFGDPTSLYYFSTREKQHWLNFNDNIGILTTRRTMPQLASFSKMGLIPISSSNSAFVKWTRILQLKPSCVLSAWSKTNLLNVSTDFAIRLKLSLRSRNRDKMWSRIVIKHVPFASNFTAQDSGNGSFFFPLSRLLLQSVSQLSRCSSRHSS